MKKISPRITPKQKRFCQEYVIDLNATKAAIRAGYSERSAKIQGSRLLTNANLQNFLAKLKIKASDKLEITHQDILKKLNTWLESDITETLGLSVKEVKALPKEVRQLISEYKYSKKTYQTGETTVTEDQVHCKFISKERAIEMINRHTAFYENESNPTQNNIVIIQIPDNGRD